MIGYVDKKKRIINICLKSTNDYRPEEGRGQEGPLSPCLDEVKMGEALGWGQCFANVHAQHTNTRTNEVSAQVHRHTPLLANTSASCQKASKIVHWRVKWMPQFSPDSVWQDVTRDGKEKIEHVLIKIRQLKTDFIKPMQKAPPPLWNRRNYDTGAVRHLHNITFILHSACVRVCVFSRDIATYVCCCFFSSDGQHTHTPTRTVEHVFSGWHMYMQKASV